MVGVEGQMMMLMMMLMILMMTVLTKMSLHKRRHDEQRGEHVLAEQTRRWQDGLLPIAATMIAEKTLQCDCA